MKHLKTYEEESFENPYIILDRIEKDLEKIESFLSEEEMKERDRDPDSERGHDIYYFQNMLKGTTIDTIREIKKFFEEELKIDSDKYNL